MQLYCINPVRILVGNWFDILSMSAHCLFNSKYYPLSKFHPDFVNYFTAGRLDKSKAKRFYTGDWQLFDADGCPLTLFQDVPCGKCTCCVDKKAMDWAFRAVCESQSSNTIPLFYTLTYNNENLPSVGVVKDDVQKFLKRLRITLSRKYAYTSPIRYFLVGEYGTERHRAHYHVVFWNFPQLSDNDYIHKTRVHQLIQSTWSLGFVYGSPIDIERKDGTVNYCLKYLRKECFVPAGKNPTFFLSSRGRTPNGNRGGLGIDLLESRKSFLLRNPNVLHMTVTDKFSGKTLSRAIPRAFIVRLYGSISSILTRPIKDDLILLERCYKTYYRYMYHEHKPDSLLTQYPILSKFFHELKYAKPFDLFDKHYNNYYATLLPAISDTIIELESKLSNFISRVHSRLERLLELKPIKQARINAIELKSFLSPDVDLQAVADNIIYHNERLSKLRKLRNGCYPEM